MKPLIVVADGMDKEAFAALEKTPGLRTHPQSKLSPGELEALLPEVAGLIVRSATKVTGEFLEKAPQLRYVLRAGEGTDNIDKNACQTKGIKIANTPGANNNSAAEHAISLMLSTMRHVPQANARMSEGGWDKSRFTGTELWKKCVGIVGFGRVGRILANRLKGFEVDILFYDPFIQEAPGARKAESLQAIFTESDIITLHLPLTPETRGLVGAELLELMPAHAILINAARGEVLDELALCRVLQENKIRAAALDVYPQEPLPLDSPLRGLPNLILTPHLGASTREAQKRVGMMALEQVKEFFLNGNLLNEVRAQ